MLIYGIIRINDAIGLIDYYDLFCYAITKLIVQKLYSELWYQRIQTLATMRFITTCLSTDNIIITLSATKKTLVFISSMM